MATQASESDDLWEGEDEDRYYHMTPHMATTMTTTVAALSDLAISSLPILFVSLLVLYMVFLDLKPVNLAAAHIRLR